MKVIVGLICLINLALGSYRVVNNDSSSSIITDCYEIFSYDYCTLNDAVI